ncbi:hypothetical protein BOX15_Mlig008420g4 [Macrostomum lignano]|uniref:Transcription factor 25 n=1 Tax=Macrostomum lignano TaxID=282301 RepID=A0A267GLH3_9PLAT|nr:hypothetical protein BOX15_Mlig008420g4 [Macrostomum lignano]
MSRRVLRKLQEAEAAAKAAELEKADAAAQDEAEDAEPAGRVNQFALLMSQEDSQSEAEDAGEDAEPSSPQPRQQKQKKKKSKKAGKRKGGEAAVDEEDEFAAALASADSNPAPPATVSAVSNVSGGGGKPLLSVDLRLLDGGQELRRLFGQAAGESAARQPSTRRLQQQQPGGWRRGLLAQPKPTWPPVVRLGLSMSPDAETFASDSFPAGSAAYRFEHSREYQRTQLAFADAVESGQPDRLAEILHRQPYHVDTLLQLAEVFRLQEDAATAADLVERALYAMECAAAPGFSFASDRCRLSFARRENRALFSALLRHALALTGRCCHRACLETCKLLLSLSPTADPMGSLLLIDAACLMSGQEEFLLRLLHAWEPSRHLTQLPNWAFSAALARFRLGRPDAAAALDAALIQFPSVLAPLLARLSVEAAPPVSGCRLFSAAEADRESSPGLRQLCGLYVQRCGHCWKEAAAVTFLVSGAARVAEAAAATPPDPRIAEAAERRRRRYRRTPLNVLRHLVVSEVRDALADLPADVDPAGLNAFDPLPPPDSVCGYDLDRLRRLRAGAGGASAADDGLLTAFLRSLMPNFDPSAPPQPQGAEGGEGGGGGGLAGLLESVRQLLNGLGPPPPPFDEEADGGVD